MAGTQFSPYPMYKSAESGHSARPAVGSYEVKVRRTYRTDGTLLALFCEVRRNDVLLTHVRDLNAASAVREARRNVRNARRCGGF